MRILITGGAGYIGGHALVEALNAGHEAHVVDNLCNSSVESLARVKQLTNRDFGFTRADIRDGAAMRDVVKDFAPEAVIHFAGLKAVGASVSEPLAYFDNNVAGTLALLGALRDSECRRFVFSSSATVYGDPDYLPIDEAHPLRTTNPYGRTKLQIEGILQDLAASDPDMVDRASALFQSGRGASFGAHRRGSGRRAGQSHAVRGPGRRRPAGRAQRLRRRLRHS